MLLAAKSADRNDLSSRGKFFTNCFFRDVKGDVVNDARSRYLKSRDRSFQLVVFEGIKLNKVVSLFVIIKGNGYFIPPSRPYFNDIIITA